MIVDSSALIAVMKREHDHETYKETMAGASCRMSVANWLESALVADNHSPRERRVFDDVVTAFDIELVAVSLAQAGLARAAHQKFGRGSGHAAKLNFGDCFAYALAKETGEPLLYKGDDFARTDIKSAIAD